MDRISSLPNDVLCHILSFLPTKHAVATSLLSSRWLNLWASLPIIDLDDSLYLNHSAKQSNSASFLDFVDRVLSVNKSQTILKFRLHINDSREDNMFRINGFIDNVIRRRNIVEIDLGIFLSFHMEGGDCIQVPDSQTLKVLKIRSDSGLKMPAFRGCFPMLSVFDVKVSLYESGDDLITKLFPCLSVLERLCLSGDLSDCSGEVYVNVGGVCLKSLELELSMGDNYDDCDAMVVIDAPRLEYLRLRDGFVASYLVKNKPAIGEVRLDVGDYDEEFLDFLEEMGPARRSRFNELLHGLVNAKFLSVSASTSKFTKGYLSSVQASRSQPSWQSSVQAALSLEKPVEDSDMLEELELIEPEDVPSCLSLRLTEIEVTRLGKVEEEEMLKYLLSNAKVLDKFTVNSRTCILDELWPTETKLNLKKMGYFITFSEHLQLPCQNREY
ncbi:hypothetical protein OSB04_002510 [Centaurea solstitialis]|uniref:F-box domain-containing protein n=1 Tax=Centaurea solstitialis TaxID=347529 RepID=A0AA38TUX1_9ASTR|nr:hypothetical protein OSB04_002510 [Centaurea solstitialis]